MIRLSVLYTQRTAVFFLRMKFNFTLFNIHLHFVIIREEVYVTTDLVPIFSISFCAMWTIKGFEYQTTDIRLGNWFRL